MPEALLSLFSEFSKIVKISPSRPAIFFKQGKDYASLSYGQVYDRAIALADFLTQKGVKKTDNVVILLGNQPEWPISFLAIQYIGAIAVPLDIKLDPLDIKHLIIHSEPKLILCQEKLYPALSEHFKQSADFEFVIVDSRDFFAGILLPSPKITAEGEIDIDKPAAIFYTSGTTDLPKGVLLSQKNILSNVVSLKQFNITTAEDNYISFLPLHHTYSVMITCLLPLLTGGRISYPSGINSQEILGCMNQAGVSLLTGVPEFFLLLHQAITKQFNKIPFFLRAPSLLLVEIFSLVRRLTGLNPNKHLLAKIHAAFGARLRYMITGGAHLDKKISGDFFKWGFSILEGYGLTETSPVATFNPPQKSKMDSAGKPIPGVQIKIVNPNDLGIGEIAIKGPNVMLGYYKFPKETEAVLKDGWFLTGDLGRLDEQGYLYIKGRKDEMIVLSAGEKVNPEEIEKHYSASAFIKEICIFESAKSGFFEGENKLMAVIVPNKELFHSRGIANIEENIKWELENLSHRLSDYKRIKGILIGIEPLPRTALGKLMRYEITTEYIKKLKEHIHPQEGALSREDQEILSLPVIQKLMQYVSGRLKRQVKLGDHLELDLGLDSLNRIELLLEIQKILGIEVPEDLAMELFLSSTVRELIFKIKPLLPQDIKEIKQIEIDWARILKDEPPAHILNSMRLKPLFKDWLIAILVVGIVKFMFRSFFLMRVKNKTNLPEKGPYIIYANHTSYLDGFILLFCLPLELFMNTFIMGFKKYFFKGVVKLIRVIAVDINQDLAEILQQSAYVLEHSKVVAMFPEGQRSIDGEPARFKKGIGILAKELNVPLIPVYIDGAYRSWPRYLPLPRPARIKVIVGKKLKFSDLKIQQEPNSDIYEAIAETLRQELIKLSQKA